jgi:aconitase A
MTLADRATIANMAPEYGATCGFFPIDEKTMDYMRLTGRPDETIALVEAYAKAQGMWHSVDSPEPVFTDSLELDMSTVRPSLAGPKRPQDRVSLDSVDEVFNGDLLKVYHKDRPERVAVEGKDHDIGDGDVVIAAITSCTNTSNPSVLIAAGLVARKARALGLTRKPWVKTSLAPGSQVVTDYLNKAGLSEDLDAIGFNLVGYGCTTCIGNSGPLAEPISAAINGNDIVAASVGQPQLRGPRQPRRPRQLPRQPAAGRRLCAQGHGDRGHVRDPDRRGHQRPRLPQGHLALERGSPGPDQLQHQRRDVPLALRQRLSRRQALAGHHHHRLGYV